MCKAIEDMRMMRFRRRLLRVELKGKQKAELKH